MARDGSAAWPHLRTLAPGDAVPAELYVLDYRDGERPRWTVHSVEALGTGRRVLVVVDPHNGADDFFGPRHPVALRVVTHPDKTLRTQPFPLGCIPTPMLCDLDQQGRRAARPRRWRDDFTPESTVDALPRPPDTQSPSE